MERCLRTTGVALLLVTVVSACGGGGDSGIRLGTVGRSTVTEVVEAPATVSAKASATVSAAADGTVAELAVREGQVVRAGALLLRIDSPSAQRQLENARRADAEAASAGNVSLPAGGLSAQQQQADAAASAAFERARRSATRIPDPTLRAQALAALEASQAQYAAAQARAQDAIQRFEAGLGSLSAALSSLSSAQRVQTRAAVDAAERTVAALTVRAPIGGTVSLSGVPQGGSSSQDLLSQLPESVQSQAGSLLGSGASSTTVTGTLTTGQPVHSGQALLTVTDVSTLSLTAQVDETDVLLVKSGVPADADLDAVPDATYPATVTTIDPAPTTSTRGGVTYVVRLALGRGTSADGSVAPRPRPGMSAVVDLKVRVARDVLAVPAAAVFRDGRRDAVWVVRGGLAEKRLVRVGAQGRDEVEVVEGLKGGERLVVRGADRVHAGQKVT
ncbi:MAG TPA: efflux RND transporter periplasmic adaptor subunit [Actinomycetes bacterium]